MDASVQLAGYVAVVPDVLLPVQLQHRPAGRPEEHLMLAVLEDAMACFQRGASATSTRGRHLFREACEWIYCCDRAWPFSFENICDTLDIDCGYVRGALVRWARCAPGVDAEELIVSATSGAGEAAAFAKARQAR